MVLIWIFLVVHINTAWSLSLEEQLKQTGYVELCDTRHGRETYDALYAAFDTLITFLQTNPTWTQKLYNAKERFIRSKERHYYATDVFGFYDESAQEGRSQIAFYYSTHFHDFICSTYKEFNQVPEIIHFLQACYEIQKPYGTLFEQAATDLDLPTIFSCACHHVPILFKVIKYLPSYRATKPHYDGTVLSLFLDSTDNQSLLLSAYKASLIAQDFSAPVRTFSRQHNHNSILLIPGVLLTEFSIYPTPHVVMHSGTIRYATIAFAMRPHYIPKINEFTTLSKLPDVKD